MTPLLAVLVALVVVVVLGAKALQTLGPPSTALTSRGRESAKPFTDYFPESKERPRSSVPEFNVKPVRYFFSRAERAFFDHLTVMAQEFDLKVFPKVGLVDVFQSERGSKSSQNYYAQKHVDYLLVSARDYQPVAGIELDGRSHESERQRQRDEVKKRVFEAACLPLIRLENGASPGEIRQRIEELSRQPESRRKEKGRL